MSSKKSKQDLNLSGFSPIRLNISSPSSYKSPGKDYGINERIDLGKEKIISGFDRWKLAEANGAQCINMIHGLKERARLSGDNPYPTELEGLCKKLEVVKTVFEDVIESVAAFMKEIVGSINILESMKDNEELKMKLTIIQSFLEVLIKLYNTSIEVKLLIIENIAHTTSSQQSQLLISSWGCCPSHNRLFRMITQLKISPNDHQWMI